MDAVSLSAEESVTVLSEAASYPTTESGISQSLKLFQPHAYDVYRCRPRRPLGRYRYLQFTVGGTYLDQQPIHKKKPNGKHVKKRPVGYARELTRG